jgi:hypothetical protein
VENKRGFRVEHLKKEDFTFFDNGEPRGIALFFHRIGDALEASPGKAESRIAPTPNVFGNRLHAADEAPGSVTVILFDALNTPFMEQAYVRDACLGCCRA